MDSSSSKVEAMKPVLFKAGIPLAVSLAGFILAKIVTRKSSLPTASPQIKVGDVDADDHEEEILGLARRIEEMQGRESQLEKSFLTYQGLKDQEMVLMELHSKMMMEINRVEFLEREVSLVEAENRRFESVAKEYFELLRSEEFHRSENEQLRERVRKLLRKSREHTRLLRKQCLLIRCKETEISRNKNEMKELKLVIEQLQGEKTAASKGEGEKVTVEDYNMWLQELDLLQKHKASEFGSDGELNQCAVEEDKSYFGLRNGGHAHARSRRRRLITKFKRWVEEREKSKASSLDEKGNKCFPTLSASDGAEDAYLLATKSCSTA